MTSLERRISDRGESARTADRPELRRDASRAYAVSSNLRTAVLWPGRMSAPRERGQLFLYWPSAVGPPLSKEGANRVLVGERDDEVLRTDVVMPELIRLGPGRLQHPSSIIAGDGVRRAGLAGRQEALEHPFPIPGHAADHSQRPSHSAGVGTSKRASSGSYFSSQ